MQGFYLPGVAPRAFKDGEGEGAVTVCGGLVLLQRVQAHGVGGIFSCVGGAADVHDDGLHAGLYTLGFHGVLDGDWIQSCLLIIEPIDWTSLVGDDLIVGPVFQNYPVLSDALIS